MMSGNSVIVGKKQRRRKTQRPRKILTMGICGCLAMGLLCGCSEEKVDYGLNTEEDGAGASGSLEQFADVPKWTEETEFTALDGEQFTLSIDANIKVPDVDSMSVVEVERIAVDNAYKKRVLDCFFEGADIYYHDIAHLTREDLEALIETQEEEVEKVEANIEEYKNLSSDQTVPEWLKSDLENENALLQEYYDALENAGEEYTVAEEFDSCDEYIGFRDGIRYNIWLSAYGDEHGMILISLMDMYGQDISYAPEGLEEYDHVSYHANSEEAGTNQCNLSLEDARAQANQMLSYCGQNYQVLMEEGSLVWNGWNESEDADTDYKEITYGYSFLYGTGVDGLAFHEFGDYYTYEDFTGYDRSDEEFQDLQATMMMCVTDEGMITVSIMYPITVNQITEDVELLPLSTIESIMKREITENFEQYQYEGWRRDNYKIFNSLELIYFRLRDKDRPGVYSYVPAWRLCWEKNNGYCYEHPILVNAIDGSVIYLEEELGG